MRRTPTVNTLLLGYGSIGQRHAANLRVLYPDASLIIVEPKAMGQSPSFEPGLGNKFVYLDLAQALENHAGEIDFAIIASPTACHLSQMVDLAKRDIPFLCEKPPCLEAETGEYRALVEMIPLFSGIKCAVAFQYRFHKQASSIQKLAQDGYLSFTAQDDLIDRYGATVGGTMASHAIDLALWTQGPWMYCDVKSNGISFVSRISHPNGGYSSFNMRMDTGPRESNVSGKHKTISLEPDDSAYVKTLKAYAIWVMGGRRDNRLATLRDGLVVMEILSG